MSSYTKTSAEDLKACLALFRSYKTQNQLQYKFIPLSKPSNYFITADTFGQRTTEFKSY